SSEVTRSQEVTGIYEAGYLTVDSSRKAFWLIQERTDALVFGWSPFLQKNIRKLVLEQDIPLAFDPSTTVSGESSGVLEVIGTACESSKFNIVGKDPGFFYDSVVETRNLLYKRVPRIQNVQVAEKSSRSSRVTWQQETSSCGNNDPVLIFKGSSNQPLEMHFVEKNKKEFYLDEIRGEEGEEGKLILTVQHGSLFALPTL
ncbi:unnamed protein product, partial [Heterobilharzia americana]